MLHMEVYFLKSCLPCDFLDLFVSIFGIYLCISQSSLEDQN